MSREAFLREQIVLCAGAYMQVRPGSRAAAEVIADQQMFRDQLAREIKARRAICRSMGAAWGVTLGDGIGQPALEGGAA